MIIYLEKKFQIMNNNLNYREELFHSLCTNVDNLFIIYDCINHKFEYISPNIEKFLGVSVDDFQQNYIQLIDYVDAESKQTLINFIRTTGIVNFTEMELEYLHPVTKTKCYFMMRVYPVYKNNSISRYITNVLEMTKEFEAKAAIQHALSETQKANEAKKEFLSHMSHELKTPINAIIGMTQIASNSLEDREKVLGCLEKINYSSQTLLSLINNILDMAKIDSNKLLLINEPFYLHDTISAFSSLMKSQAEIKQLHYSLIYQNVKHDYLIGDSLRLTQILGNCLSNAIKFTPSGGKITLELMELPSDNKKVMFRFIISDTGKGMREEYLDHIFTPFEQEDRTINPKYGGSGLGMSIVKTLLNLMGGSIQVDSQVDLGTVMTIDLSFDLVQSPINQPNIQKHPEEWKLFDCTGMHVLVVEDNDINREIACEFLNYINVSYDVAVDGYEAIQLFEASPAGRYHAILMDVHMPGINGYETANLIRASKHPDSETMYIIAMTADNFANNFSCIQSGMNYHITKPIEMDKFYSILHAIHTK